MKDFCLGVDIDGTVVEHRFPDLGPAVPYALIWLKIFQKLGIKIIVFTMRSDDQDGRNTLTEAVDYLKNNGIKVYGVNTNPTQTTWTTSPKAYCQSYIDDASIGCPLIYPEDDSRPYVDWESAGPLIMNQYIKHLEKYGV